MKTLFVLFFGMFSILITAQDIQSFNYDNKPVHDILMDLEKVYEVKFGYESTSFGDKLITFHINASNLGQILSKLESQLNVIVDKINERWYVIKLNHTLTICGHIKDGVNNTSLQGTSVITKLKNKGTISNAEGFFELNKINESDTLQISFLGFRTIELPVKQLNHNQCETYKLVPESYQLTEVVINEYLTSGIEKTLDGAIKINPNDLDILSGLSEPDILQSTQLLPGIESSSETASELYIRGSSPDQNLILWDGIKMYNSNHFFGTISAFNPYITKDAKIYKSGTKAQYGDRVSGVLDISTDDEVPTKTEGGFGLNMTHGDLYLKIPFSKKFGILLSGRRSINDFVTTPTFNNFSKKVYQNTSITKNQTYFEPGSTQNEEDFYFTDVTLKMIAQLSQKDHISISNILTKNKLDYRFKVIDREINSNDQLSIQNLGTNTTWERHWNDNFLSKTQLYYSKYDLSYNGKIQVLEENYSSSKENNIKEFGTIFHTDWNLNNKLTFSNGYQYFVSQVSYDFAQGGFFNLTNNVKSPTHALYSQLNYSKPDKWYFDIGLRANHYTYSKLTKLQPRLYIERFIGKNFKIKASAEVKSQAVNQILELETRNFGLESQVWVLTEEYSSPILTSDQYSLGFLFTKNGWLLDIDAYHRQVDGLTSIARGFESVDAENLNFIPRGESTTKGIDVLLKKKINKYSTWLSYTHSTTDFLFPKLNQGIAFKGNNDITHSLNWAHSYKWNNFQFSLGWKYRTGIPYSKPTGIETLNEITLIKYTTHNDYRLPDYHRLDFSALYEFKLSKKNDSPRWKLGLSILNLYGRKNILRKTYSSVNTTNSNGEQISTINEINNVSLKTTPNFMLRFSF
ncbi:outer membrane receptor protein involved in Fe transport [Aquimarina sp. MAR_2010_214]|uniref:TonB-dependent receptor n=1 Tax=Aquimarina sp. MAR_2010_214 TaxID=1250026 RepID=UPI000C7073C4|nr:TonB-dependent receptor [Aquimarina sp. MAR_2010_214]PKV53173.1 outer membrane receptor protein involved in Fe transport [Aquimarina sp. MAR_2010_214]